MYLLHTLRIHLHGIIDVPIVAIDIAIIVIIEAFGACVLCGTTNLRTNFFSTQDLILAAKIKERKEN